MSQRHRTRALQPPKMDLRAHAHNERHRIHSELHTVAQQVSAGVEPDEVHEPGRAWVPEHRPHTGRGRSERGTTLRHWKLKSWKRRTAVRKAKAQALRAVAERA